MSSPFSPPNTPTFGRVQNVPFMLNIPQPRTEPVHPWIPPTSPLTVKLAPQQELRDVDMAEPSPPRLRIGEEEKETDKEQRLISVGGMRRVFRSRQKANKTGKSLAMKMEAEVDEGDEPENEDDSERSVSPVAQNTSNHYTLNLPSPIASPSDTPYVLLG